MNRGTDPTISAEIDKLCDRFESEWKTESRPNIEVFLAEVPPARADLLFRELLGLELEFRTRAGEDPQLEEYRKRFPSRAAVVCAAFDDLTPQRLVLTATEGPEKGKVFTFAAQDYIVAGRSAQALLSLKDGYVGRHHFIIEINPPHCRLSDMGSVNGTFVNGQKIIGTRDLHDGDVIGAGRTALQVTLQDVKLAATREVFDPTAATLDLAGPILPAGPALAGEPTAPLSEDGMPTTFLPAPAGIGSAPGPSIGTPPSAKGGSAGRPIGAAPLPSPSSSGAVPALHGYRILRELGRGSMGVVYLGERESDGKKVALKTVAPAVAASSTQLKRFFREAMILCQLRHHYIVTFYELGETGGRLFFVMEYIDGTDAAKMLQAGPLTVATAVRMTCQMLSALHYAHGKGFVHRDIKPGNLLVEEVEGKKMVKVTDFGLARVYQESHLSGLTRDGETGGTIAFIPPEQITQFRKAKPAADQYSAAATLYNLLTNAFLFDIQNTPVHAALTIILEKEPIPIRERRPDLPGELAQLIHRALAKDPAARFPDVHAFRKELLPFAK